jgi:hypothetical protein
MSQQSYALTRFFQFGVQLKILVHFLIVMLILATKLRNSVILLQNSSVICTFLRYWIYTVCMLCIFFISPWVKQMSLGILSKIPYMD